MASDNYMYPGSTQPLFRVYHERKINIILLASLLIIQYFCLPFVILSFFPLLFILNKIRSLFWNRNTMFLQNTVRDVPSVMSYVMCSFYVSIYNVTTRHVSVGGRDLTVDLPHHMSSLWLLVRGNITLRKLMALCNITETDNVIKCRKVV
jgi:hypothetical protein